ncbi:MAG: sugar ABC transporter ATP-binding protein [Granulosicoccus sp.]
MNEDSSHDCILQLKDVSKVYSGIVAVKHADFSVYKGAVNVLVGENGAGKSTLMKLIAGTEKPTDGQIFLNGESVSFNSTSDAVGHGIGMVYQELNLFGNLTVAENIFITREITHGIKGIDHKEQQRRATHFLNKLQTSIKSDVLVDDLRIGEQQLVEIAKAVSLDARILIMDEPTSALSSAEVEVLFKVIEDLKDQGVAIIYVSHRLDELIQIGDFITVLRDGEVTGKANVEDIDTKWIVRQMIGSDAKDFSKAGTHKIGTDVFEVKDICLPGVTGGYQVNHVSLNVRAGEIVGLYGLMGAGRSELFDCIMGNYPHSSGQIYVEGKELGRGNAHHRIKHGIALIPEDRQREGLIPALSIAANLSLSSLGKFLKLFHIDSRLETEAVKESIKSFTVKAPDPSLEVTSLSGGNQQKVVIGKALMTEPKILLMDEPSRGIDVGAKADVFRTMRKLSAQGLAILFATSDLDEVMALSDRIAVMSNGKLTGVFDQKDATNDVIVKASAMGHSTTSSDQQHSGEIVSS